MLLLVVGPALPLAQFSEAHARYEIASLGSVSCTVLSTSLMMIRCAFGMVSFSSVYKPLLQHELLVVFASV